MTAPTEADITLERERKRARVKSEANVRVAALFAKPPADFDLVYAQLNNLSQFVALLWLEAKGAMTVEQIAPMLDAALSLFQNDIQAIRNAENVASAALDAAGADTQMTVAQRLAEIDAVTPAWPA